MIHFFFNSFYNLLLGCREDIGITRIDDAQDRTIEEFSAGRSQGCVVARVVMDISLGKHGQVLQLGLAKRGAVGADQNHLGLASAKCLGRGLEAENSLA